MKKNGKKVLSSGPDSSSGGSSSTGSSGVECAVLTSGFTVIEPDLIPGEKPDKATKTPSMT